MRLVPFAGTAVAAVLLATVVASDPPANAMLAPGMPAPGTPAASSRVGWQHSTSVEDPYYPGRSNPEIDTQQQILDLAWDGTTLTGKASITFRATMDTDAVRLDLIHSLRVSQVLLDVGAESIAFSQDGYGLVLQTGPMAKGTLHRVTISYSGTPHPVKAPSRRGDLAEGLGWTLDGRGHVYTLQEPYGAYSWYPVNDHPSDKARFSASITVPDGQSAVFNGRLTSHTGNTWNWVAGRPVASYLTTIAIGPYTAYHDTLSDGTKATYWLLPRDASIRDSLKAQTAAAFDWLSDHAGPYPFGRFGIVVTGGSSAMETQSLVTLSRQAFDRPDAVIEHEMAHQWYGDAVTPLDWQGLWLNEGWAMWMQQAYETDRGGYRYLGGMDEWRPYDEQSRQDSGPPGDYDPRSFGDLNVYLGPAMMLDKIRQRVGDAEFTALSTAWVKEHKYGNVTRAEFVRWLNTETGQRFNALVNLWLDSPDTPEWP